MYEFERLSVVEVFVRVGAGVSQLPSVHGLFQFGKRRYKAKFRAEGSVQVTISINEDWRGEFEFFGDLPVC